MGVPTEQAPSPSPGLARSFHPRTPLGRGRLAVFVALALLTAGAWALTVYQARSMGQPMGIAARGGVAGDAMSGMAMSGAAGAGWSLSGALAFIGVWVVMMAAMMFPAATPLLLLFSAVHAGRRARGGVFVPTWI
ncbi:MAG TPA: DUF2182 domain-containing protein, partial [Thermomicrobiales bacterium]|nr:DUF2182 domain-containing protein [Thermomicrobiales bacterium]